MKILTWNVNGLRSLIRQNAFSQLFNMDLDIICLQETKLSNDLILNENIPKEYTAYSNISSKKGQAGVSILSRMPVIKSSHLIGHERFDLEGRYQNITLETGLSIHNLYIPHGKRDQSDLPYKIEIINCLKNFPLLNDGFSIICSDFNIALNEIDLARAKNNRKNTMFTDLERITLKNFLNDNYVDAFRVVCDSPKNYTWWPYSYNAREKNIGWRIDYILVSKELEVKIKKSEICKSVLGSDHCPVLLEVEN